MERRTKNGIEWLEFPLLNPYLRHGIVLRRGGVSASPFDSLNTCARVGDDIGHVHKNLVRVCNALALPPIQVATQIHGDVIASIEKPIENIQADGFVSNVPGICMGIHHADCQAAIFYDPKQRCLAIIHCGWRGNCLNIYHTCVRRMEKEYGSCPCDILVGISPSLGPKHAEFRDWKAKLPPYFSPFIEDNHVNFWEVSRMQLLEAGILPEHIEIAQICTYESPGDFFSYRREKETGRNLLLAYDSEHA